MREKSLDLISLARHVIGDLAAGRECETANLYGSPLRVTKCRRQLRKRPA